MQLVGVPLNFGPIKFDRAAVFHHDLSAPINFELGGEKLQEIGFVAPLDAKNHSSNVCQNVKR